MRCVFQPMRLFSEIYLRFTLWALFVAFGCSFVFEKTLAAPPPTNTNAATDANDNETIETHLYALKSTFTPVPRDPSSGGAIAPLHNDLLLVTPYGRLFLVDRHGDEVVAIDGQVPMGLAAMQAVAEELGIATGRFRVMDILLKRLARGRYRLFATHLYFTGTCIRVRLSSTTIGLGLLPNRFPPPATIDMTVSPSWKTIFEAEPCLASNWSFLHESGGKMLMDGNEHLLVTIGNYAKWSASLSTKKHFGKLLRIHIDTGDAEIIAQGLRNAQGLTRDRNGNLWETEHGAQGGDELNLIESGGNYGYPRVSYGVGYGGTSQRRPVETLGRHDGFARPVFAWVPSIGITSIVVNDERFWPLWADDLLVGSLGDQEHGQSLWRIRRHGRQVQYVERIKLGKRVRDIAQLADGRIALLLSSDILFLSRNYAPCYDPNAHPRAVYAMDCPLPTRRKRRSSQ